MYVHVYMFTDIFYSPFKDQPPLSHCFISHFNLNVNNTVKMYMQYNIPKAKA